MASAAGDVAAAAAAAVAEQMPEGPTPDEAELGRFLTACGGVAPKAAHVYVKSKQWREQEGVDTILTEEGGADREARVRRWQQYVDGLVDLEGRPVAVWRAGRVNVRSMMVQFLAVSCILTVCHVI